MKRPRNKTLLEVTAYLASIGLSVYGDYVDLNTGQKHGGCADYKPDDVVKFRSLVERDAVLDYEPQ